MQVNTIAEQLFFTIVRIDTITTNGEIGAGTGFFFSHKVAGLYYPFIVTNKHVVMDMREGRFLFLKSKDRLPLLGDGFTLNVNPKSGRICGLVTLNQMSISLSFHCYHCLISRNNSMEQIYFGVQWKQI